MTQSTRLITAEQVAEFFAVSPETVRTLARNRDIPAVRIGRSWRFSLEALVEWFRKGNTTGQDS